ncbi:MAG: response regulator [Thermodesulfobacteriota bacterium]|nr:response regulator [Thermodesulfobacteriota bacterium]
MNSDLKILVIDDDSEIRTILGDILVSLGYGVIMANDGLEGIDRIKECTIDLIMCDVYMPNLSGLEFLKEIKKIEIEIPVVMVTGLPDVDIAVEAMKEGAADFISKPFRLEQIENVVKKLAKPLSSGYSAKVKELRVKENDTIEKLNGKLNNKIKELSTLYFISETLGNIYDGNLIFKKIVEIACNIADAGKASILIVDKENYEMITAASQGFDNNNLPDRVPITGSIMERVIHEGRYINVKNINDHFDIDHIPDIKRYNSRTFVSIPLLIKNEVFGILNVTEKNNGKEFTDDEVFLLLNLAKKSALAIENNALYESINRNFIDTLQALITTIEAKDFYTRHHSQRVTQISIEIAQAMSCSQEEVDTLSFTCSLHDIGKIGINDSILLKPGPLTREEFETIKTHPVIGANIVKSLDLPPLEMAVIRNHHERWDGNGYPDELKGKKIPILARIVAVADAFDAMTSDRPYRKAKKYSEALDEMIRCRETQFDPEVVSCFEICLDKIENKDWNKEVYSS